MSVDSISAMYLLEFEYSTVIQDTGRKPASQGIRLFIDNRFLLDWKNEASPIVIRGLSISVESGPYHSLSEACSVSDKSGKEVRKRCERVCTSLLHPAIQQLELGINRQKQCRRILQRCDNNALVRRTSCSRH